MLVISEVTSICYAKRALKLSPTHSMPKRNEKSAEDKVKLLAGKLYLTRYAIDTLLGRKVSVLRLLEEGL